LPCYYRRNTRMPQHKNPCLFHGLSLKYDSHEALDPHLVRPDLRLRRMPKSNHSKSGTAMFEIVIDTGGTFTDALLMDKDRKISTAKFLKAREELRRQMKAQKGKGG